MAKESSHSVFKSIFIFLSAWVFLTGCGKPSQSLVFSPEETPIRWSGAENCWMNKVRANGPSALLPGKSIYRCHRETKEMQLGFYQDKSIAYGPKDAMTIFSVTSNDQGCELSLEKGNIAYVVLSEGKLDEDAKLVSVKIRTAEETATWACSYFSL